MLIKNFVPRYHCSQLSIRPCPLEFLITCIYIYMYIHSIYTLIKVPSTTRNSVAGPIMRTSANNFATHRTIRDMHRIRCWARNSGWKGFSPVLFPFLIVFHSTDKEAALNIKVILFLLFVTRSFKFAEGKEFSFGYKFEENNNSNDSNFQINPDWFRIIFFIRVFISRITRYTYLSRRSNYEDGRETFF